MYQFFINSEDSKVIDYLKFLTFLSKEEIEDLEQKNKVQPHLREAHKALAREVITFIHGKDKYEQALKISEALFSGNIKDLTGEEIEMAFNDLPSTNGCDCNLVEALIQTKLASSKREAREFITNGAVSVNGEKQTSVDYQINSLVAIDNKYVVLRRGKKQYAIIKFI